MDSGPAPPAAPELETWESLTLGLHDLAPNISECDSDMAGYDWLQSEFALEDRNMFDVDPSDFASWSQLATLTVAASWPTTEGMVAVSNTASSIKNSNGVLIGQRLTTLVSEIQQQLRKLEEGPWHTDRPCSLDDYPIGTILELSQQFSTIAGPILRSTVCIGGGSEGGSDDDEGDNKTASVMADTPTMLLVMCGYMWLVRIYGVVLGHFQKHLHRMPTNHQFGTTTTGVRGPCSVTSPIDGGGDSTNMAAAGQALRLGELPCADMALGLQQIHMAVRMLLEVLHDIEGHLGRGAGVARDMAVTLLLNSGRRQDGSSGGLGKKATAVKELLREKMGL